MGRQKQKDGSTLQLIEESLFTLLSLPKIAYLYYSIGAVPFLAVFCYFYTFCLRHANAPAQIWINSIYLGMSYLWLKVWQARFTFEIWQYLRNEENTFSAKAWYNNIVTILIWSPHSLYISPLAVLSVIGGGYFLSFFNSLSITSCYQPTRKDAVKEALIKSKDQPNEAILLVVYTKIFFFIIWANLMVCLLVLPSLMYSLLGIDYSFTRNYDYFVGDLFFWIVTGIISYLLIVPFLRTAFALRLLRSHSQGTGFDLLNDWRKIKVNTLPALVLFFLSILSAPTLEGKEEPSWRPQEVETWVKKQSNSEKYLWQFPPELLPDEQVTHLPQWLIDSSKWIEKQRNHFEEWLREMLDKWNENDEDFGLNKDHSGDLIAVDEIKNILLIGFYVVAFLLVLFVAYLFYQKMIKAPTIINSALPSRAKRSIDLEDETITADLLPHQEWFDLATRELSAGKIRHALRAFFLGELSWLDQHNLLQLKKYKTNFQYFEEVGRNAFKEDYSEQFFKESIHLYELYWYGGKHPNKEICERWVIQYLAPHHSKSTDNIHG